MIYFDSSVLIEYWMTEGLEIDRPKDPIEKIITENEGEYVKILRRLLKTGKRVNTMVSIRKKLVSGNSKVTVATSPLSLLELMEWNSEIMFKEIASQAAGVRFVQRKSKKEVGDYLKKLLKLREEEVKNSEKGMKTSSTGLEIIMSETWLNRGFVECHGLQGILQVGINNFSLTVEKAWQEPSAYAYLQLGVADTFHILIAQHLGCEYIASFDSDFKRVEDIIKEETGMTLLDSPEKILAVL